VDYEVTAGVARITLNRPNRLNALDLPLLQGVTRAFHRADTDPDVRCVLVTGSGAGFCAGADLKDSNTAGKSTGKVVYERVVNEYATMITSVVRCSKPVIAAINGAAAGAGASLALACDFRVMAEDSYLLQAFINIGLVVDAGSGFFLTRLVGYCKALELVIEGKPISARTCLELGIANKVVSGSQLMATAGKWAEELAQKPTFAVGLTKKALLYGYTHSLSKTLEYEARLQQFCVESEDHAEGRKAFLEKRRARFTGKALDIPCGTLARL